MSSDFWRMGGYAFYVWSSFGAAALVFGWNVLAPGWRRRDILRLIAEDVEASE